MQFRPVFIFIFFSFFFPPTNQPPPQHATLLRHPCTNGTYKIALDRTSNEFSLPRALPRGEEEEEEDDDNIGPDFSFGQFRRALNRSMASSRTNQRDREMDSRHFGSGIRIDEGRERRHREDVHVGGAANTTTLILNVYNNGGFLSERKECP